MNGFAQFFKFLHSVGRSTAFTIPKGKANISGGGDFIIPLEWSAAPIFGIIGKEFEKFNAVILGVLPGESVYAFCATTYYNPRPVFNILSNINCWGVATSYYGEF